MRLLSGPHFVAASQIASGTTNVATSLAVASLATAEAFGAYSVAVTMVFTAVLVFRSSIGASIALASASGQAAVVAQARFGNALVMRLVPVWLIVVASWPALHQGVDFEELLPALILLLAAPLVLWQDGLRYVGFAEGREARSFVIDLIWLVPVAAVWLALLAGLSVEPVVPVLCWLVGCVCSILAGRRILPLPPGKAPLTTDLRGLASLAVGSGINAGSALIRVAIISAVLGLGSVAALSAAQLLMTPINMAAALIAPILVPRVASAPNRVGGLLTRAIAAFSLFWGFWFLILWLLPDSVLRFLLGESLRSAEEVVIPVAIASLLYAVLAVAVAALNGLGDTQTSGGLQTANAFLRLAFLALGLLLVGSTFGVAWAQVFAALGGAVLGISLLIRRLAFKDAPQGPT